MFRNTFWSAVYAVLIISGHGSDTFSDNVALFWNLYDSVVTGSRILNDISEGVGAVSKAIKAIDTFLDTDSERQLEESVAEAIAADSEDKSPDSDETAADQCDETTGEGTCPAKSKKKSKSEEKAKPIEQQEMPKFNGCGALGFHIRDANLPVGKMIECCGVHNTCYSSACRANKRDCDYKLRTCLFSTCDSANLDRSMKKPCYAAGKLLFSGTMALSYQQYKDAQEALKCPGKNDRYKRRK